VFLDARGRVKVGDFGIARLEGSELTQSGVGLGTPGYTAPEVLRGGPADARSDVFALGVLAYRLLTGQRPFEGATREAVAVEILERPPVPPSSLKPDVPGPISAAVMRALAKRPEERTPSAEAFAAGLGAPVSPAPPAAPPPAPPPTSTIAVATPTVAVPTVAVPTVAVPTSTVAVPTRAPAPRRRRWIVAILLALAALAAGAFVAFRASPRDAARQVPSAPSVVPRASPPATHPARAGPVPSARPASAGRAQPAEPPIEDQILDAARHVVGKPPEDARKGDDKKGHDQGKGRKKGHGKDGNDG
jgi:serine/threonine-protein kinase